MNVSDSCPLSLRELRIVDLAAQGYTDEEISAAVGINLAALNAHFCNIQKTLRASTRIRAVVVAIQERWVLSSPQDPSLTLNPAHISNGTSVGFSPNIDALTPREQQIWLLMPEPGYVEKPYNAFAAMLGITEATLKTHMRSLFSKLGVNSRVEAALLADRFRSPL